MPRTLMLCAAVVAIAACRFDADYRGGTYACSASDPSCPAGQTCNGSVCTGSGSGGSGSAVDAAVDAPAVDAARDATVHALTCSDPGVLAAGGGTVSGSTGAPHANRVTSLCAGVVQNGADAVYAITLPAATPLRVAISGAAALDAYVIAPCDAAPDTPTCLGNAIASAGNPLLVTTTAATTYYVVVDSEQAAATGSYSVVVTRP